MGCGLWAALRRAESECLVEAPAASAWPLLPARASDESRRPGQRPQLQPPAVAPPSAVGSPAAAPGSQAWWPRWQPLLAWLWVLPSAATLWVTPSLGASVEEAVLNPQGLTSLTRSLREPSRHNCSRMAPAYMRWNSFWSVPEPEFDLKLYGFQARCWNSADWPTD